MIKFLLSDFSRVLLFPIDENYAGSLNELHAARLQEASYTFFDTFSLNNQLLDWMAQAKLTHHLKIGMFTSETIQEYPVLQPFLNPVFDVVFSAKKLGLSKSDPQAYTTLCAQLNILPSETMYIDDAIPNVAAATTAGLHAVQFMATESTVAHAEALLNG
ncbi:HAD-IA family hydrolase [Candidatus Woesebacteria bacterium]|nr:HAD-IA family hydrolase [Candidatus Woesebacteria bacterium]